MPPVLALNSQVPVTTRSVGNDVLIPIAKHSRVPSSIILSALKCLLQYKLLCMKPNDH